MMSKLSGKHAGPEGHSEDKHHDDIEETKCSRTIQELFKPLLVSMSFWGVYFQRSGNRTGPSGNLRSWRELISRFYCSVVIVLLMIGLFNHAYFHQIDHQQFDPTLAFYILVCLFHVNNIFTACVIYISCYRENGLLLIFKQWHLLDRSVLKSQVFNSCHPLKRFISGTCGLSWVAFIETFVISILTDMSTPFNTNNPALTSVLDIFSFAVWFFPLPFVINLTLGLWMEFSAFNKDFKRAIQANGKFVGDFEGYRRHHQAICNLVYTVDDNFSALFGSVLVNTTGQILLLLYVAIWHTDFNSETLNIIWILHWTIFSFIYLCSVCFCGGIINQKAHEPLTYVYDCDIHKNKEISVEIQIFLSRLNGEKIGLTAMKMIVIDKTTILTVFGVLMTYYLVLMQFQTTAFSCNINSRNITSFP